jgi:hypothetical protein
MAKRTTEIIFIIFANILLFAHVVVPHHHHNKMVYFGKQHCQEDCDAVDHDSKNRNDNQNDDDSSDCILKEPVVLSYYQGRQEFKFLANAFNQYDSNNFQYCSLAKVSEAFIPISSLFSKPHTKQNPFHSIVTASFGLRAPPVV